MDKYIDRLNTSETIYKQMRAIDLDHFFDGKPDEEPELDQYMVYSGVKLESADVMVLKNLEKQLNRPIPQLERMHTDSFGFVHERRRVTGLSLVTPDSSKLKLPKFFYYLDKLELLYLRNNQLGNFPEVICKILGLSRIMIADNGIKEIPPGIGSMKKLYYLDLSGNQIQEIPYELSKAYNLKELYLSRNKIRDLSTSMFKLPWLRHLKLDNNQLKHLGWQICKLAKLTYLNVKHNQISRISEAILSHTGLTSFKIRDNKLPVEEIEHQMVERMIQRNRLIALQASNPDKYQDIDKSIADLNDKIGELLEKKREIEDLPVDY